MVLRQELEDLPEVVRYEDLSKLSKEARNLVHQAGRKLGDQESYSNWVQEALRTLNEI